MTTNPLFTAIGIVVCLILGVGGVYYMIDLVNSEFRHNVQKQQASGYVGPLDEAMADTAGVPRRPKQFRSTIPDRDPLEFSFE